MSDIRRFGQGKIETSAILPDGNCLLRSIYAQRFRSSFDFAEENVDQLIHRDRAIIYDHVSSNIGEYFFQLKLNGLETRRDPEESEAEGVFRALNEIQIFGTFAGEEVIIMSPSMCTTKPAMLNATLRLLAIWE